MPIKRVRRRLKFVVCKSRRFPTALEKIVKSMQKALLKEFLKQRKALITYMTKKGVFKRLEAKQKSISASDKAFVSKFIDGWNKNVPDEKMEEVFNFWYKKAAKIAGNQVLKDIGISIAFDLKNPEILRFLKNRGEKITGAVTSRTLEDLRRLMLRAYQGDGMSPYDLRKSIAEMFEETYLNRSMAIARTEVGTVQMKMQHEAFTRNDVPFKKWVSIGDARTRESHLRANGQTVKIDEPFILEDEKDGTIEMMHPLDPTAPASQVINCRCTEVAVLEGYKKPSKSEAWAGE